MFMRGSFGLISAAGLLQILSQERRSVQLRAWRGGDEATLLLTEGMVVAAHYGASHGPEAVYRFAAWDGGSFEVVAADPPDEVEMAVEWEELLLEGARLRDESEASLPPYPPYPAREALDRLVATAPALAGFALVGYDGRLLAACNLDQHLTDLAADLCLDFAAISRHFGPDHGVALYAGLGRKLLIADLGAATLALAVPAPGASINEASAQLSSLLAPARTFAMANEKE